MGISANFPALEEGWVWKAGSGFHRCVGRGRDLQEIEEGALDVAQRVGKGFEKLALAQEMMLPQGFEGLKDFVGRWRPAFALFGIQGNGTQAARPWRGGPGARSGHVE